MLDDTITILDSLQQQLIRGLYINLLSFVILYYDYALTLSAEVDRFWSTKHISWASMFFYINRYLSLFGHIPVIFQYTWDIRRPNSTEVCAALSSYHQYLAVIIQVIVGILLIMRTYALYDRSIKILLFTCACGLAVIVFGIWTVISGRSVVETIVIPQIACVPPTGHNIAIHLAAAWTGMLLFDVLIFAMTLYKSVGRNREGHGPLLNIFLRDGAIYFGIMALASLLNIISFRVLPAYERGFFTTFANVISSTMISRLMLNLRDPKLMSQHDRAGATSESDPYSTDNPVFSTFIEFNTFSSSTTAASQDNL